ncbi:unnamed protein product [Didymodactylos carnosus]|uniref:Uncharacterized protein n=1 Tax=Didymodactylos carnosus TaxID=1234261 RepID=A0A813WSV3_9BILA|nr:unnamed protein product [Didymodactylos carnosus]CAF1161219.1 unnamed protein product [Didymodactylos carnosus]CAF3653144.1 unnamed protein product [Didymodactylos carnosus]CAF3972945.1 unnamed protein product [Didymodactylos carnosus]
MPRKCEIKLCTFNSSALCSHCNKNLCTRHLTEHTHVINNDHRSLVEQVNQLFNKINRLTPAHLTAKPFQQLDEWRNNSHQLIDSFYQGQRQEIDDIIQQNFAKIKNELAKTVNDLKNNVEERIREGDQLQHIKEIVQNVERDIFELQTKLINVEIEPLTIHAEPIQIPSIIKSNTTIDLVDLKTPIKALIFSPGFSVALAANNDHLLTCYDSKLHLYKDDLKLIQKIDWKFGKIMDMCYHTKLNRFIILTSKNVFTLNISRMTLNSIETIKIENMFCISCNDTSLFVSSRNYGTTISEYGMLPTSFHLTKRWEPSQTCSADEFVNNIRCNTVDQLVLTIWNDLRKEWRLDLKDIRTFKTIWSLDLNMPLTQYRCGLCMLPNNDCLVVGNASSSLYQISSQGKLRTIIYYKRKPLNATMVGRNLIAIITHNGLNMHDM